MDSARNLMELPPRTLDPGEVARRREAEALVSRLQAAHPELAPETIADLVEEAFAELQSARVQSYRSILAERSVRRRLRSAGEAHP